MIDLTEQLIKQLRKISRDFNTFFEHHFREETKTSLTPKIVQGKPTFPKQYQLFKKDLTLEEKLRYYEEDINEWNKEHNMFPKSRIIIKYELM